MSDAMSEAMSETTSGTTWNAVSTERRRLADELECLSDEQWQTRTGCDAWTVEEMVAHVLMPLEVSTPAFMWAMVKNRGDFDRAVIGLTDRVFQQNTRSDMIAKLRANADNRWTPPRYGPEVPLSEIVVHGQDIRHALGLPTTVPTETIELTLAGNTDDALRAEYARRIGVDQPRPAT